MRQCLYISTAVEPSEQRVEDILEVARRKNAENGITGVLLFNGRNFMQLIEGLERDLRDLLGSLAEDSRHTGMSLLADRKIDTRDCPGWAMNFMRFGASNSDRRALIAQELPSGLAPSMRDAMLSFGDLG